jgi:ADP-heptose:LPS heptosyltransferase
MQQILFVELLGGLGDVIIALPAIHALKRSHPGASLTVLTFAPGRELISSDPLIDRVLESHRGEARLTLKRWPAENFVAVGKALQTRYGATILVAEGSDPELAETVVVTIAGNAQILPRRSLRQLAAILSEADLVIAADTGPARIAAALAVPTITLFGPSWHGRYGEPSPHVNLQSYPTCLERNIANFTEQACWYSGHCPLEWNTCLEDIDPDKAIYVAISLLGLGPSMYTSSASLPNLTGGLPPDPPPCGGLTPPCPPKGSACLNFQSLVDPSNSAASQSKIQNPKFFQSLISNP